MGLLKRACILLLLASASLPLARAAAPREYDVKAVFLFHFVQFVDWPPPAFADARAPFVICVLGTDPFGAALDDIVRGEQVDGRALKIDRHQQPTQLDGCHILFIDRSMRDALPAILARLGDHPTLTVGDFDGFARAGGMIRFVTFGQRIRLHINLEATRAAQLNISSKLLRPARILRAGED